MSSNTTTTSTSTITSTTSHRVWPTPTISSNLLLNRCQWRKNGL